MRKVLLYGSWIGLYGICALLGCVVGEAEGMRRAILILFSLLFFVPPTILLVDAIRKQHTKTIRLIRWISFTSLLLTMLLLVGNIFSAQGSETLGLTLYYILIFISVPMISSQYWFLSLFLWACLFCSTIKRKRKS